MDFGPQMCARYSLTQEEIAILIGEVEVIINIGARYNIAPTQIVPAIVRSARGIETVDMQWGFKSAWSKQPLINAKAETIATTAFRHHLHQCCLIPADGFYEWTADRTPIRFTLPDNRSIQSFAPNNAPTPAVRPMARAPQKVTRTTDFKTGEPPARAAKEPSSARKASELPETTHTSADSGTKKTSSSGRAAPTENEHAEAKAA